jgi:hypothetical protein
VSLEIKQKCLHRLLVEVIHLPRVNVLIEISNSLLSRTHQP